MISRILRQGAPRVLARLSTLALLTAIHLAPVTTHAAVLGSDDRNAANAFLSEAEQQRFEGLGRIECSNGLSATGWLVGSNSTVVTAAHTFFRPDRDGNRTIAIDPGKCAFVLYDRYQNVRETAQIQQAYSPWADATLRGDSSHDFAVLKLARPLKVTNLASIDTRRSIGTYVNLVAFQTGVPRDQLARITQGEAHRFPVVEFGDGTRISNAARLFATSADSSPGSSGGLYYDSRTGSVIGMHLGSACDPSIRSLAYDATRCFNYGLRFDRGINATIQAAIHDLPLDRQLIVPTIQPTIVAMLPAMVG
jgi:V8-like Glu-specific endopeptidase